MQFLRYPTIGIAWQWLDNEMENLLHGDGDSSGKSSLILQYNHCAWEIIQRDFCTVAYFV